MADCRDQWLYLCVSRGTGHDNETDSADSGKGKVRNLVIGVIGAKLVLGVFAMLVFAAFVEAYWSSIAWMPGWIKVTAGLSLWLAIPLWLWRGGRGRADAES